MPDQDFSPEDFMRKAEQAPSRQPRIVDEERVARVRSTRAASYDPFGDDGAPPPPPSPHELPPIDFAAELNEQQHAAVTAEPGPALVLAGAGSGKTRTLTYRVAYLLHQGVRPWEILLLTFTNKAAREMLDRVEQLTGVSRFRFWGGTFHSIGQRILRQHGTAVGLDRAYTILDQGDAEALMGEVIRAKDPAFLRDKNHPKAKVIGEILSYTRNTTADIADVIREKFPYFENLIEHVQEFALAYERAKREQRVADFDDLLELWLKLLRQEPSIAAEYQRRFRHILVDEYQDTNTLQAAIVDTLGEEHHQVMAVGDDAQCIYTWRGANFDNIMSFPQRHPNTRLYKIEMNYRSSPEILAFANEVLLHQPSGQGYDKKLTPARGPNQRPYLVPCLDARQESQLVVRRIQNLLSEGQYRPEDIAVLYRAHYQSVDLQKQLFMSGVSYTITSGVRFFEKSHIKDVLAMLRFLSNPKDGTAFNRFAELLPKVGTKTAEKLRREAGKIAEKEGMTLAAVLAGEALVGKVPAAARDDWKQLALTLQDVEREMGVRQPGREEESTAQTDLFVSGKKAPERPATTARESMDAGEIAPPEELVRLLVEGWYGDYLRTIHTNWSERRDDLDGLISFAAEYDTLPDFLAQITLLTSETSDRSSEPAEENIRLTTIHQAKGLEFPIVFIVGLADGMFPLKRAIEEDTIEEERRLFYVAVTRAKDELYLLYPKVSIGHGPPTQNNLSRFVGEVDPLRYEKLQPSTRYA